MLLDGQTFAFVTDESDGTWVTHASMPTPRAGLSAAVVNGKIYAIGGTNTSGRDPTGPERILVGGNIAGFVGTNEEYDPATRNWTTKTNMPTPRALFATAVYQNKIYCFGGRNAYYSGNYLNTTEVYDPATDTWTAKADMPTARDWIQANVVNNKIYIIGGEPNGSLNQVYDPQTDTWTNKTPSNQTIFYQSATLDNKIYIINGYPQQITQIYHPASDRWTIGGFPPHIIGGTIAATSGAFALKRIYLFGYVENYVYNPATDSWTESNSRPLNRVYFASANVNDTIFLIGGYNYTFTYESPFGYYAPLSTNEQYIPAGYGTPDPSYQPPTPTPTTTPTTPTPTPTPTHLTPSPSLTQTPTNIETQTPTPTQSNHDYQPNSQWTIIALAVVVVTVVFGGVVFARKKR